MVKITEQLAANLVTFLSTNYGMLNTKEYDLCIEFYRMVLGKLGYNQNEIDELISDTVSCIIQAGNHER